MLNIKKIYLDAVKLKGFLRKTDTKIIYFVFSAGLSLLAAFLEGIGTALLLPLVKGILQMDFGFINKLPVIKNILPNFFPKLSHSNSFLFSLLVGTVFVTLSASNLLRYLASITISYQLRKLSDRLRRLIFNRYLSFGKLFFDRNNLGYLQSVLISLTNRIADSVRPLHDAFNQFFSVIIYFSIMCLISYKLAMLAIFILPISYYSLKWLIKKIKKTSQVYVVSFRNINEKIFNILSCIPLVKIYTQEENEKEKFYSLSKSLRNIEFSMDKKNCLIVPIQDISILFAVLLFISFMSFLVIKEKVGEISSFLVFFYLLKKTSNSLNFFNIVKTYLANINGPIVEILKLFADKDKFFVVGGQKKFTGLKTDIKIENLNFSYYRGGANILKEVSFSIVKGKIAAIVGPTGAGKTTLINLLLRFYDTPDKSIFIDGTDIKEFTLGSWYKSIALVSQEVLLFNDTIKNNIIYGLDREISDEELVEVLKKARLYDFVMQLPEKFNTYIGDRGVKLSGGEKQRATIARALLKNAEILILDEATSSLDSKTERLIQEAIDELTRDKTTIVIAHRLSTIKNAAKIIVIEEGKFVEEGTLSVLLEKRGKFYEYWGAQKFY
jgi:ABC-type multidrug transport system fused ATPase/permease subunit